MLADAPFTVMAYEICVENQCHKELGISTKKIKYCLVQSAMHGAVICVSTVKKYGLVKVFWYPIGM